jgi:hypothetical protein
MAELGSKEAELERTITEAKKAFLGYGIIKVEEKGVEYVRSKYNERGISTNAISKLRKEFEAVGCHRYSNPIVLSVLAEQVNVETLSKSHEGSLTPHVEWKKLQDTTMEVERLGGQHRMAAVKEILKETDVEILHVRGRAISTGKAKSVAEGERTEEEWKGLETGLQAERLLTNTWIAIFYNKGTSFQQNVYNKRANRRVTYIQI